MSAASTMPEPDKVAGAPHPREATQLIGQEDAEQAFLSACKQGRMPHAWLIGGDVGIGKATLAYRIARAVFSAGADLSALENLDVAPAHPAARQIIAQSHPDLSVLKRGLTKDKKGLSSVINVEDVRDVLHRLGATSSSGGYRVCIVDSADDLNTSSANALLKMIEEPPSRTLFLLISHRPGRLLPTIRSRCRKVMLRALSDAHIRSVINGLGDSWAQQDEAHLKAAIAQAEGSVQRTINALRPETRMLIASIETMLLALPRVDLSQTIALAETFNTKASADDVAIVFDFIHQWVCAKVRLSAQNHAGRALGFVETWSEIQKEITDVMTYNLDKRPLLLGILRKLASVQ